MNPEIHHQYLMSCTWLAVWVLFAIAALVCGIVNRNKLATPDCPIPLWIVAAFMFGCFVLCAAVLVPDVLEPIGHWNRTHDVKIRAEEAW